MNTFYKNISLLFIVVVPLIMLPSFAQQKHDDDKPDNLKVLSKKLTSKEVVAIMKVYTKSLGVKCVHCHVVSDTDPRHLDFVSDANPKKDLARKMIKMVNGVNRRYISKIKTYNLKPITCVTCHMGDVTPTFSVDSLPKAKADTLKKG